MLYAATEHDSVYAFDADSVTPGQSAPLWKVNFLDPANGVTTVPEVDVNTNGRDIIPEIGITGTPVIDDATNTLYVVAKTKETTNGITTYVQRLHALDIASGAEKFGGPVVIAGSVPGTGLNVGNTLTFDALRENQRPSLALSNGVVYIAFASHGDFPTYYGWMLGYNASNLQQVSILNTGSDGDESGIWQGGAPPSIDAAGNIYISTGNGDFTADQGGASYGDTALKVAPDGHTVLDWFTPFNQQYLTSNDLDLGSTGMLLLPDQPGPHPHEAIFGGKEGRLYLVDRDMMGHYNPAGDTGVVQEIMVKQVVNGSGLFMTPVYYNNQVYVSSMEGSISSFSLTNGRLSDTPVGVTTAKYGFPGAAMTVSGNGGAGGIVWVVPFTASNGALRAYDANDLTRVLYDSGQVGPRDAMSGTVKFNPPTVVNGRVFVGMRDGVTAFGVLSGASALPPMPTALTATTNGIGRVDLAWLEPTFPAVSIKIERSTDGVTFSQVAITQAGAQVYYDSGLAPSTHYYYRIRATNGAGDTAYSAVADAQTPASSLDPTLIAYWPLDEGTGVTAIDATGHHHDGTLVGETNWVDGRYGNSGVAFHVVGATDPHVAVPDSPDIRFSATQSYTLSVWASPNSLQGRWQSVVSKSRDTTPFYGLWTSSDNKWTIGGPATVTGSATSTSWHLLAMAQDGTAGTRTLYVDGVAVGTGPAQDGSGTGPLWIGGGAGVSEFFNGAVDDVRLYGRALPASEVAALAATYNPGAPTGLTASANANSGVVLSWTLGGANDAGIKVERSPDGVNYTQIAVAPAHSTTFTDTGLVSGIQYTYRVRATNTASDSAYSNLATAVTIVSAPNAPTGLAATPLSPTDLGLRWTDNAGNESGFKIERSSDGVVFAPLATVGANVTSYTDSSAGIAGMYWYRVRATNTSGDSAASASASANTLNFGLNARLAFDDGSGSTAVDGSGNGHTALTTSPASWVAGRVGSSALSVSAGGHAAIPDAPTCGSPRRRASRSRPGSIWPRFATPGRRSSRSHASRASGTGFGSARTTVGRRAA